MANLAVFLDRDGTLNEDPAPGYLSDPERVKLMPYVGNILNRLKDLYNFKLIVVSNQSGIARGLITTDEVNKVNERINALLREYNVCIDQFYFCPYHPDFNTQEECKCRKPSPEMVLLAAKDHNINLTKSYIIGDSTSDIECGMNAGLRTILILSGHGRETLYSLQKQNKMPRFVAGNFLEAGNMIINDLNGDYN